MNIPLFKSFFKTKTQNRELKDSITLKNLKECCTQNGLILYENVTIYHHAQSYFIPLLAVDLYRGIYIFEYKQWSFDDLKGAKIQTAREQESTKESIAFEKTNKIIRLKFNELTHNDGVDIFNFVLMENLSTQDYEKLDENIKNILLESKLLFYDLDATQIEQKLSKTKPKSYDLPSLVDIIGTLLIQHRIIDKDSKYMATKQQITFIEDNSVAHHILYGQNSSGKTSALLLKALLHKLRYPQQNITIISPTTLSCDILKQKLLDIVENAIIEFDLTSINITTPSYDLNTTDFLICDDADLMKEEFITYLKEVQNDNTLIIATSTSPKDANFVFEKIFNTKDTDIKFFKTNPYAKTLQLVSMIAKEHPLEDILIVCNNRSKEYLYEDLEFFVQKNPSKLDASKNIVEQKLNTLLLATYDEIISINAKFVIMLDTKDISLTLLNYALNMAKESVYVLYEKEEDIASIKNRKEI